MSSATGDPARIDVPVSPELLQRLERVRLLTGGLSSVQILTQALEFYERIALSMLEGGKVFVSCHS